MCARAAYACAHCSERREHHHVRGTGRVRKGAARCVGGVPVHTSSRHPTLAAPGWRRCVQRWADEFDPWTPRPGDYVLISVLFLGAVLLYVGERSCAVQLNRRVFQLEERAGALRTQVDVLVAEAVALADRRRIVTRAREELGMTLPSAADIEYVYYVPDAVRDLPGARREVGAAAR